MDLVRKNKSSGFTLAELMVATLILGLVLVGLLGTYVACLDLTELSKNSSIATNIAMAKIEEVRNDTYANIKTDYDSTGCGRPSCGKPFDITGLMGKGVSYVDNTNPDLLKITVTVCWRQRNGRIIGEDTNLNGQLDAGEDKNGNGMLDSIAQVVTYIASH
jgi:prepilin-type N-terminal cleavage/methylation domain-containing protein